MMTKITRTTIGLAVVMAAIGAITVKAVQDPAARGQGRGGRGIQAPQYPVLALGSDLPAFSLLGIDAKRHSPMEYAKSKLLVVVFLTDLTRLFVAPLLSPMRL